MESFGDGLLRMLLRLEVVSLQENDNAVLVFATGCAIVGCIAVVLDLSFYLIKKQSLLRLNHGKYTVIFLLSWALGAFIMGYVGQMAKIFQVSLFACALVGFGWPILFTSLLERLAEKQAEGEPEQQPFSEA
jgi:hypothetical protein